jgi:DNA-binding response OmpR family regulator
VAQRESSPIKIVILGGDLLVSRSLELALRGAGYDARYLNGSFTDEPTELLDGVRLVIFAPRMSTKRRRAFLNGMRTIQTAGLPVLELATTLNEVRAEQDGVDLVAWPCPTEELTHRIEATLRLNEADPEPDSRLGGVRA